ncbi:MAG TPA: hypothetical protein VG142_03805 [Trebonia sp.]|nr:hypothetical protein [Trebonia sp.]
MALNYGQVASAAVRPPTESSYYVAPGDTYSRAQELGCDQAKFDNSHRVDSFVTLDFGAQRSDGGGTYLPGSVIFWPNSAIERYSLRFAYGYQSCRSRHVLIVGIGTSNDGAVTDGRLGADWGTVVAVVAADSSRDGYRAVAVQGAIDAEPGFGPFPHFEGWEWGDRSGGGYVSRSKSLINDFGSADGCPQNLGIFANEMCGNGWTTKDEYDAVWGWKPNEATPEIYFNGCHGYARQANQWADISDYGKHNQRSGKVLFVGPLDQGNCLSASAAWSDFDAALGRDGVSDSMKFSTQMTTR